MLPSRPIDHQPIFLLGAGRCGSTFQQSHLSRIADIWIWGEHDGILRQAFDWINYARNSKALADFSFVTPLENIPNAFNREAEGDATRVAWLNGFRSTDLDILERQFISGLFTRALPPGKSRWGFKEIRYSSADRVAEQLLSLFPQAKVIHTVRDPFATIESSIISWNYMAIQDAVAADNWDPIRILYLEYATRWEMTTRYYLDLEDRTPHRVKLSRLEDFSNSVPDLLKFLNVDAETGPIDSGPINANAKSRRTLGEVAQQNLIGMRQDFRGILIETAKRAGYEQSTDMPT